MTELIPLSPFADIPGRRWTAPPLSPNKYDPDTLERLMRYLECSPIVLPWMECTEDLIGGKFKVLGGSATMSDGKYFWRYEAGMYLRHYPIRVPGRLFWVCPGSFPGGDIMMAHPRGVSWAFEKQQP